jgi:hypothetical protein
LVEVVTAVGDTVVAVAVAVVVVVCVAVGAVDG